MGEPRLVKSPLDFGAETQGSDITADGLEFYYSTRISNVGDKREIWVSKRPSLDDPWDQPVKLNIPGNGPQDYPTVSPDGLEIYLSAWALNVPYLRLSTRTSRAHPWSLPENVTLFDDDVMNQWCFSPDLSGDGLTLYFAAPEFPESSNADLWMATRISRSSPWGPPIKLGPGINGALYSELYPSVTADGLTLFFGTAQGGGPLTLWVATRPTVHDDWRPARRFPLHNSNRGGHDPSISPDGSTLYFDSGKIYQVTFQPMADLNLDGIVGIEDMSILLDHWGEEGNVYDLAPLPLGDGIVNEKDLRQLLQYWGQAVDIPPVDDSQPTPDPRELPTPVEPVGGLVLYCPLNGDYQDASGNGLHGTAVGGPIFQAGALGQGVTLNGIDQYVEITGYKGITAVDRVQQAFSISNWFKTLDNGEMVTWGARPGGQRLSWRISGGLRTEHGSGNLRGNTVANDGEWHHAALVVNEGATLRPNMTRIYLDGLENSTSSGSDVAYNLQPDTDVSIGYRATSGDRFFPGSLDEVRIYDRILSAAEIAWLAGQRAAFDKP